MEREDQTILEVLEALEQGTGLFTGPRGDETSETLARLYTEALGLLPYELAPEVPRPEVKARLLRSLQGEAPQTASAPAPVPLRASQETQAPRLAVAPPASPASPQPVAMVRRPSRWPLALAASLALLFLGFSVWLYTGLVQQNETIARLTRELEEQKRAASQASTEAGQIRELLDEMRDKFSLVTSRAVEVCPMRPVGEAPLQPNARGILFVAADHQHWYMSLEGLEPAAPGKVYTLWFVAEQGTVSGGSFTAKPGETVELSSKEMPAGTKSAMITLEEDSRAAAGPSGPEILRAAAIYQMS